MKRINDLDHDYMLPSGVVRVWLTSDEASYEDVSVTVAYSLGRPPVCIVNCSSTRLAGNAGEDVESMTRKIVDKTHNLLHAAPSGHHVDSFCDVVRDWIENHRRSQPRFAAAA